MVRHTTAITAFRRVTFIVALSALAFISAPQTAWAKDGTDRPHGFNRGSTATWPPECPKGKVCQDPLEDAEDISEGLGNLGGGSSSVPPFGPFDPGRRARSGQGGARDADTLTQGQEYDTKTNPRKYREEADK